MTDPRGIIIRRKYRVEHVLWNDDFADALELPSEDREGGTSIMREVIGQDYNVWEVGRYTVEDGEPGGSEWDDPTPYQTAWFTWIAPRDGEVTFTTEGSRAWDALSWSADSYGNLDTKLAVYTGATLGSLVEVASNDDVAGDVWYSTVVFNCTEGVEYKVQVGTYYSDYSGLATLKWRMT